MNTKNIFSIKNNDDFVEATLQIFRFQHENNAVYRKFCDFLKVEANQVKKIEQIPFLPIRFFKSERILSVQNPVKITFTSSGTTAETTSSHLVTDITMYQQSYIQAFTRFYGKIENYVILALLPSYLEREGSSLIYMVNDLIQKSNHPESGFYLYDFDNLSKKLIELDQSGQKIILIGVSYALLDFVENRQFDLKNTIVMETGGMKGKRKEIVREELHHILQKGFGVGCIHSEYGMTELLSQAYSFGKGIFRCPMWMQVFIRQTEDELTLIENGKTGGINIIDLANYNSCSFIATQDLGKKYDNRSFEVLGRFDNSDIRGCNLLTI